MKARSVRRRRRRRGGRGGHSEEKLSLRVLKMHKGRRCSMQGEWAVYLRQRSCVPLGLFQGSSSPSLPRPPAPAPQLNPQLSSTRPERKRASPLVALGRVLSFPPSGAENGGENHAAPLPSTKRENKQTPNAKEVLIKSQTALQLRRAASQNKKLFVVGLLSLASLVLFRALS